MFSVRHQLLEYLERTPTHQTLVYGARPNQDDVIWLEDYLDQRFPDWETNWQWVNDSKLIEDYKNRKVDF